MEKIIYRSTEIGRARLALLGLAFLLSFFGPLSRTFSSEFTVLQQVYLRTTFASVLLACWLRNYPTYSYLRSIPRSAWFLILSRSFGLTIGGGVCFSFAVQHTSLAIAGFLGSLPFTVLWSWLIFSTVPTKHEWVALFLAVTGLVLIFLSGILGSQGFTVPGSLAAILSGLGFSYGLASRKLHQVDWPEPTLSQIIILVGALECLLISLVSGEGLPPIPSLPLVSLYIVAGLLVAISGIITGYAFNALGGSEGGILLMLEIPFSLLLGFLLYNEILSLNEVIGGSLILIAGVSVSLQGELGHEQ